MQISNELNNLLRRAGDTGVEKKENKVKKESFKAETIKRVSPSSKCY